MSILKRDFLKKQEINIVWIKRDIRSQDHESLFHADAGTIPFLVIYLFEPSIIKYKDTSLRHLQFQYHSIQQFNSNQQQTGKWIHLFYAEAQEVFESLNAVFEIKNMFSYQESGISLTWRKDKWVAQFCKQNNIKWTEFQKDGVVRGILNRENWDKLWFENVCREIMNNMINVNIDVIINAFNNFFSQNI